MVASSMGFYLSGNREIKMISWWSATRGPSVPQIFGPLTYARTVWEKTTRFCMVIELDARKIIHPVDRECRRAICLR